VADTSPVPKADRRANRRTDRRKRSRSGRRSGDPHTNWRRVAWLFAAYAAFLSIRSFPTAMTRALPERVKRLFRREPAAPA
jgi:hypothetical protein